MRRSFHLKGGARLPEAQDLLLKRSGERKTYDNNNDCLEAMKQMEDNSIDLTVTSPPYDNLRTYNGNNDQWGEHVWKECIKE